MRFLQRHGDHHALARSQAVSFDHDRCALRIDVGVGCRGIGERLVAAVGMPCSTMKRLAKSFELSSCAARLVGSEDLQAGGAKGIDDAGRRAVPPGPPP